MITAVTAPFGVVPLGQGSPSCLPEPTEHGGGESIAPGACGEMQHLGKVTHQHHVHLRWDARKNKACDRACKRALGSKTNYKGIRPKLIQRA